MKEILIKDLRVENFQIIKETNKLNKKLRKQPNYNSILTDLQHMKDQHRNERYKNYSKELISEYDKNIVFHVQNLVEQNKEILKFLQSKEIIE